MLGSGNGQPWMNVWEITIAVNLFCILTTCSVSFSVCIYFTTTYVATDQCESKLGLFILLIPFFISMNVFMII